MLILIPDAHLSRNKRIPELSKGRNKSYGATGALGFDLVWKV